MSDDERLWTIHENDTEQVCTLRTSPDGWLVELTWNGVQRALDGPFKTEQEARSHAEMVRFTALLRHG